MKEEGCELSNGVNYAFRLYSDSWFGSYECRVHRFLLDSPVDLMTKKFEVGGHTWKLKLKHTTNGHLGARLWSGNKSMVSVHACFTLVNHNHEEDDLSRATLSKLAHRKSRGFHDLASIAVVKDRKSGFLLDDCFTVRLDMRIVLPENEAHLLYTHENSAIYVWRLKHLNQMSGPKMISEKFNVGGLTWDISLYPHGRQGDKQHLALLLRSFNPSDVRVHLQLTGINAHTPEKSLSEETVRIVKANKKERYPKFLKINDLNDKNRGFLKDGWITLVMHVSVQDIQTVASKEPTLVAPQGTNNEDAPKCIFCFNKAQTSGLLHGKTAHKCYCLDCARYMATQVDLRCPICGESVERVIETML